MARADTPREIQRLIDSVFNKIEDKKVRKKAITKGLRAGAKPVVSATKAKVPVGIRRKTGRHLKATIGVKLKSKRGDSTAYVGARLHDPWKGYHAHLVEEGRSGVGAYHGTKFFARAVKASDSQSQSAMVRAIQDYLKTVSRG